MRSLITALLLLALCVACRRPEVEAFGRHPDPIMVSLQVPQDGPRADAVASEYADALRARLATHAMVVPAGESGPPSRAELLVTVTRIHPHAEPSPATIGTTTGIAVGTLSAMAGNRDAFFDGLFWGLFAGSSAANARDWDRARLGYLPVRVNAEVLLLQSGRKDPLLEFTVRGREVLDEMEPLELEEHRDPARIREEEAKAFARVVVARLQERFHWLPLAEPSYYRTAEPLAIGAP